MSNSSSKDTAQPSPPDSLVDPQMQPCPECRGEMVEGWLPDADDSILRRQLWVPGQPKKKRVPLVGESPVAVEYPANTETIPVTAFRCVRCGFLKFYARS